MFIGQSRIVNELNLISSDLKRNSDHGINVLLRAPSGYGKTVLSFGFCNSFDMSNYEYIIPDNTGIVKINEDRRTHILDEIHTCKNQEYLYPLMDTHKYVFVLTTNETGELKEALQNRCINLTFEEYTDDELISIILNILGSYNISKDMCELMVTYSRTPRVLVMLCQRLTYVFNNYFVPKEVDDFRVILETMLNIKDGMDEEQRRYINFLTKVRTASLDLISASIRIDKSTIKRDIEPALLYKNKIVINSKGRSLI